MAEVQEGGQLDCNGSICGLDYHHLHRTEHTVYGHGALSNVWQLQQNAVCGQCGKWPVERPEMLRFCFSSFCCVYNWLPMFCFYEGVYLHLHC